MKIRSKKFSSVSKLGVYANRRVSYIKMKDFTMQLDCLLRIAFGFADFTNRILRIPLPIHKFKVYDHRQVFFKGITCRLGYMGETQCKDGVYMYRSVLGLT